MQEATQIFNRLSEVEKIKIRAAGPDRLAHLADTSHSVDMPLKSFDERVETMQEVQALCMLEMATKSGRTTFDGITWKF